MKEYKYIIIGGGMAGSSAVMGIRKNDPRGSIALFSEEQSPPYNRPPLTKGLWDGKELKSIMRPMESYHVDLILGSKVTEILPGKNQVTTANGQEYTYQKLLLATGGSPNQLPNSPEGVIFFRTLEDFKKLKKLAESKDHFCVIGGGFIGSEITAALIKQGKKVTMIFPEEGISSLHFPNDLAEFLNDYYREKGVTVYDHNLVTSIVKQGDQFQVEYRQTDSEENDSKIFDGVVVGIGTHPNISLAKDAGIEIDRGILVNENLQTNFSEIFAAGDVCNFFNQVLGIRQRVEHEDNANTMGMRAGLNMSGLTEKYKHFPFFYSDLFDLGYEAIGELNKEYDIYSDWIEPYKKGTVYFLHDGKIRGLIFWNLWGNVDKGRQIIQEGKTYQIANLKNMFT